MITLVLLSLLIGIITACIYLGNEFYRYHIYAWYIGFPPPKYLVVLESDIMIPMEDGVKLASDVYRPKAPGNYPVIIARTPYDKTGSIHPYRQLAELFASQGYVFIVQDIRGKNKSEGEFEPFLHEGIDGNATIKWAGTAPWSNGKVALFGFSYLGSCAWLAANYKSPYLRTIIPMFTTLNTYSIWIDRGIPYLKGPLFWLSRFHSKKENKAIDHNKIRNILWELPVCELDISAVNHKLHTFRDYIEHLLPGPFWERLSVQHPEQVDMPVLLVGGWYDPFLPGVIEDFLRLINSPIGSKNRKSHLIIGPWAHNPVQKFKGVDFGKKANFNNHLISTLNWCNEWLKDNDSNHTKDGKISYFLMGKNEWRETTKWPPENVHYERYYLDKTSGSTLGLQPHILSKAPSTHASEFHFIYDPHNPVPFRGSYLLYTDGWIGPSEQSEITARNDVIIYNSFPLKEELVVVGPMKLVLFVSSTAIDTDFCAKICDIRPDGKSYSLQAGVLRMRYRDSLTEPKMMEPGNIYKIEIPLRFTAHAFLKKHRIQLQITSSDFPAHDRNLNTGLNNESSTEIKKARQTIYAGGFYESYLLLPVLSD